jgi:E3 ubiquitin-protein ligase HECTD2
MINDLKPVSTTAPERDVQGLHPFGEMSTNANSASFSRGIAVLSSINTISNMSIVIPLSTVRTRALIEQCIIAYLLNRFGAECKKKAPTSSILWDNGPEAALPTQGISRSLPSKTPQHRLEIAPGHNPGARIDDFDGSLRFSRRNGEAEGSPEPYLSSKPYECDTYARSMPKELPNLEHTETSNSARAVQNQTEETRDIFRLLEDYIITSFTSRECVNNSFTTVRPGMAPRAASEGARRATGVATDDRYYQTSVTLSEMDPKTLLIGNFAENGAWWTGDRESLKVPDRSQSHHKNLSTGASNQGTAIVTLKSPRIDWIELHEWYSLVLQAGRGWKQHLRDIIESDTTELLDELLSPKEMDEIEHQILEAQAHTQRVLLKATESLLKRPGAALRQPDDIRFLLIILANPLLYPSYLPKTGRHNNRSRSKSREPRSANISAGIDTLRHIEFTASPASSHDHGTGPGQHSGIIKRVLGLLSNLPNECHHHLVAWFARFSESHFQRTTELVGSFVTYRLSRQHGKQQIKKQDSIADLIPSLGTAGQGASAALHATLSMSAQYSRKSDNRPRPVVHNDDWQIRAAARVMALLFSANNIGVTPKSDTNTTFPQSTSNSISIATREKLNNQGQILAISSFYNTLLDYSDLIADFEAWEAGRAKFSFCQYPFFLSIWAKIQIMEHDARRQMEVKAREAFFDSIMTRKTVNQYLVLRIRRNCLVEDSLKGVSEVVGSGGEEIKKGLRIEFKGEEGIDAGGLRKEWFLLLVRDVFNPEHGMIYIFYWTTHPDQSLRHVRL